MGSCLVSGDCRSLFIDNSPQIMPDLGFTDVPSDAQNTLEDYTFAASSILIYLIAISQAYPFHCR